MADEQKPIMPPQADPAPQTAPPIEGRGATDVNEKGAPENRPELPEYPGVQLGQQDNEKYPGRSPNHTFYIEERNERTALNKNYPKPGEGSSGTGPFPPEYDESYRVENQRATVVAETE